MEIEIGGVTITGPLRGKGRVTTVDAATVHQFEMDVLVMSFHTKMILKDLAAGRATPWILTIKRNLLGTDEATILVSRVGYQAIVHIHGRCGG